MLNEYQQQEYEKDKKHIIKNKQKVSNLYFQIDRKVNKLFPDLIRFNIPKLLATYPSLTRKELFELFVQYKSLMKICIALNKSMKILNKGVDFRTFHQGVSQMSTESEELAKKIFNTINVTKNNYLSWEEFLKGMITIKSESISDKIDMFFKIIDTDGNGLLSYEEVLDLSLMSLKRNIKGEDNASLEIINELAKYFADLIFKLVDVDKDDEIPLPKIKEVIFFSLSRKLSKVVRKLHIWKCFVVQIISKETIKLLLTRINLIIPILMNNYILIFLISSFYFKFLVI
jgi:Ca2+-binding EF-hand superfamily protein